MSCKRWFAVTAVTAMLVGAVAPASAAGDVVWHRSLDASFQAVVTDANGHIYAAGFAPRGADSPFGRPLVMVLAKFDPQGDRMWTRTWRSAEEGFLHAIGWDVAISPDGRTVYVGGAQIGDSWEYSRPRLWAFSSAGALRWTRAMPIGGMVDAVAGRSAGVVAAGYGWLGAWSRDGRSRWRTVEPGVVRSVSVGADGAIYSVGFIGRLPRSVTEIAPDAALDPSNYVDADVMLTKHTAFGVARWVRVLADRPSSARGDDAALAVDVAGRRVFVAGEAETQADHRAWLARLSTDGHIVWTRRWGGSGSAVSAVDVATSPWGPVYVVSDRRRSPALVLRAYAPASGAPVSTATMRLTTHEVATAVMTGWGKALYVSAREFAVSGDLWRLGL